MSDCDSTDERRVDYVRVIEPKEAENDHRSLGESRDVARSLSLALPPPPAQHTRPPPPLSSFSPETRTPSRRRLAPSAFHHRCACPIRPHPHLRRRLSPFRALTTCRQGPTRSHSLRPSAYRGTCPALSRTTWSTMTLCLLLPSRRIATSRRSHHGQRQTMATSQ